MHANGDGLGSNFRVRVALVVGAIVVLLVGSLLAYSYFYSGRVFPGVSAASVDLGGLSSAAALDRISVELPALVGPITLRDPVDGRTWSFSSEELGIAADVAEVQSAALEEGHQGSLAGLLTPIAIAVRGRDILPDGVDFDEARARQTLGGLASEVDVPPVDAELRLEDGELVGREPQLGHQLDITGTIEKLRQLASLPTTNELQIEIQETAPRIGDRSGVKQAYEKSLSAPVHVVWEDWLHEVITVAQLDGWIDIEPVTSSAGDEIPTIVFDYDSMRDWVAPIAERINRPAENARFRYNTVTGQVELLSSGNSGITMDIEGTLQRIVEAAYSDDRTASPAVDIHRPAVSAESQPLLGAVEEMAQSSTSIAGAPASRMQNLLVAVRAFDGVALGPGQGLSFNETLGDVSTDSGYDMAIIEAARLASDAPTTDLLGGVEQLSTVAFRAAFWAGLRIVERHSPMTRSGWVEPPIGLDASVDGVRRDLRFINDTEGYILIQVHLDSERAALVWTLYGEPDGRRIDTLGPEVSEVSPAIDEVVTVSDGRLAQAEREQAAWAREGASALVIRTVSRNGEVIGNDSFESTYSSAADVVVEGPSD